MKFEVIRNKINFVYLIYIIFLIMGTSCSKCSKVVFNTSSSKVNISSGKEISLSSISSLVFENGFINANISLSEGAPSNMTFEYECVSGTATKNYDFSPCNGYIAFAKGEQTKQIQIYISEDNQSEEDEEFYIQVKNGSKKLNGQTTIIISGNNNNAISDITKIKKQLGSFCFKRSDNKWYCTGDSLIDSTSEYTLLKDWNDARKEELYSPVELYSGNQDIVDVSTGDWRYVCVALSTGGLTCSQRYSNRILPTGSPAKVWTSHTGATETISSLEGTRNNVCYIYSGGAVKCVGYGSSYSLGNNSTSNQLDNAVEPTGLSSGVTKLVAGAYEYCALLSDQTVTCWGRNLYSRGNTINTSNLQTPSVVPGLTGVIDVDINTTSSCVVLSGGNIKCWGRNTNGQLGDGTTTDSATPVDVVGINNAVKVFLPPDDEYNEGPNHDFACALLNDGSVKCWGNNTYGQLANGTTTSSLTPVLASKLSTPVTDLNLSDEYSVAHINNSRVQIWGYKSRVFKEDKGAMRNSYKPLHVPINGKVKSLSSKNFTNCAVTTDNEIYCWGFAPMGHFKDFTNQEESQKMFYNSPFKIEGLKGGAIKKVQLKAHGVYVIYEDNTVEVWGENLNGGIGTGSLSLTYDQVHQTLSTSKLIKDIEDSNAPSGRDVYDSSCALLVDDSVECWGHSYTGDGTTNSNLNAINPTNLTDIKMVVGGAGNHLALKNNGELYCWGENEEGSCGQGHLLDVLTPTLVPGMTDVKLVAMNGHFGDRSDATACAIKSNDDLYCWGYDYFDESNNDIDNFFQGGSNDYHYSSPVLVMNYPNIKRLAMGESFYIILTNEGKVYSWGINENGQCGQDLWTNYEVTSVTQIEALNDEVDEIQAGTYHACALLKDQTVKCWGDDKFGQLGQADAFTPKFLVQN